MKNGREESSGVQAGAWGGSRYVQGTASGVDHSIQMSPVYRWWWVHKETRWLSQGYSKIMLNYRDINLLTKVHSVKVMVLPVVMYGCENWTIKKVKQKRIEAFNLWCWRRVLRVPWISRRSNQSVLKEINSECSLTDAEAEAPVLWPPDAKSQLIGKDWRQKEKGTAEDEMVR